MNHKPVVGVDARAFGNSGLGRYLSEILARLLVDDRFGRVVLLGDAGALRPFADEWCECASSRVEIRPGKGGLYSPGAQLGWAVQRALLRLAADVWFFPHYDVPLLVSPRRSVVTVQDLTHFQVPKLFPAWKRAAGSVLLDHAVRSATRVLVTSAATRGDLIKRVPDAVEKVSVIPLGVSAEMGACSATACSACARVRELRPYLLCVGNRKPHKNFQFAVDVLSALRPEWPALRLVVVGRHFDASDGVRERAVVRGVGDSVVELEGISDLELRCLYSNAEALLFPSLYEGFGLPILEAMACGTPVVASNRASVPEVVGDAGLVANAADANEFAGAVRAVCRQPVLREELVRRGRIRAAELSWDRTAADTLETLLTAARAESSGALESGSR